MGKTFNLDKHAKWLSFFWPWQRLQCWTNKLKTRDFKLCNCMSMYNTQIAHWTLMEGKKRTSMWTNEFEGQKNSNGFLAGSQEVTSYILKPSSSPSSPPPQPALLILHAILHICEPIHRRNAHLLHKNDFSFECHIKEHTLLMNKEKWGNDWKTKGPCIPSRNPWQLKSLAKTFRST